MEFFSLFNEILTYQKKHNVDFVLFVIHKPSCLMSCLWSGRNARTFKGEEKTLPMLKFTFLQQLYEWLKASNPVSFTTVS